MIISRIYFSIFPQLSLLFLVEMKSFKKQKHAKLLESEGFGICQESSTHVVLKNAGIVNGFTCSKLCSIFEAQTTCCPREVQMFERKPYCLLVFNFLVESSQFVNVFDGFIAPEDTKEARKVLYCFFVDPTSVPSNFSNFTNFSTQSNFYAPFEPPLEIFENLVDFQRFLTNLEDS